MKIKKKNMNVNMIKKLLKVKIINIGMRKKFPPNYHTLMNKSRL